MKMSSISTVSVIALTGLFLTLASSLSAKDSVRGERTMDKLPAGARVVRYNGERCWYADGQYIRNVSVGVYTVIAKPVIEETDEQSDNEILMFLPEDSKTVYLGGERCWTHDGVYYRQVGRGYQKFAGGNHVNVIHMVHSSKARR